MPLPIAIIGAGTAGLTAAKAAKDEGLPFTVFEQSFDIGGVWRPRGAAWYGMHTNISRHTSDFSDFPSASDKPDFYRKEEVYQYLVDYAKHYQLLPYIHLYSKVEQISQISDGWLIKWCDANGINENKFSAVIIATGRYAKPIFPPMVGRQSFTGNIIHSSEFRAAEEFSNKKVLIVGSSFSGVAIAEEVAKTASQTINLTRKHRWILPRYIAADPFQPQTYLPYDLFKTRAKPTLGNDWETYQYYLHHCQKQNTISALRMEPSTPFNITIADHYVDLVIAKKIKVIESEIDYLEKDKVFLRNGQVWQPDHIIFCTGYSPDFSYFDLDLQRRLQAIPERLPSLSLYEDTFHPDIPGLAFISITYQGRGAIAPSAELQARLACGVFSGRIILPSPSAMQLTIAATPGKRDNLEFNDALARLAGILPNEKVLALENPTLYKLYVYGTYLPTHYRLEGDRSKTNLAWQTMIKLEMHKNHLAKKGAEEETKKHSAKPSHLFNKKLYAIGASMASLYLGYRLFARNKNNMTAPSLDPSTTKPKL